MHELPLCLYVAGYSFRFFNVFSAVHVLLLSCPKILQMALFCTTFFFC